MPDAPRGPIVLLRITVEADPEALAQHMQTARVRAEKGPTNASEVAEEVVQKLRPLVERVVETLGRHGDE